MPKASVEKISLKAVVSAFTYPPIFSHHRHRRRPTVPVCEEGRDAHPLLKGGLGIQPKPTQSIDILASILSPFEGFGRGVAG